MVTTGIGAATVNANAGTITVSQNNSAAVHVVASDPAGSVNVNVSGATIAASGTQNTGLYAQADGGITINVSSGSISATDAGIFATAGGSGAIDITVGAGASVSSTGDFSSALSVHSGTGTATRTCSAPSAPPAHPAMPRSSTAP